MSDFFPARVPTEIYF